MINKDEEKRIYKKITNRWDRSLQYVVAVEEMAELTKELTKKLRGKINYGKMAEEIGDVQIMTSQLIQIFTVEMMFDNNYGPEDPDQFRKLVKGSKQLKLQKLKRMLEY